MKFQKTKTAKPSSNNAPRDIETIRQEAAKLLMDLGQAQYLVGIHTDEVNSLTAKLREVNEEGGARIALDKVASASKEAV